MLYIYSVFIYSVYIYVYTLYIHAYTNVHICLYVYMFICICICICMYMSMSMSVSMYIYIYIYTYIYMYIYIYIYIMQYIRMYTGCTYSYICRLHRVLFHCLWLRRFNFRVRWVVHEKKKIMKVRHLLAAPVLPLPASWPMATHMGCCLAPVWRPLGSP